MGNFSENIRDNLEMLRGKPANHITSALKKMSENEDGTMADGLINLANAFVKDKQDSVDSTKITYGVAGFVIGTICVGLITGCIYVYEKSKKKKKLHEKFKKIEHIMDNAVNCANAEEIELDVTNEVQQCEVASD